MRSRSRSWQVRARRTGRRLGRTVVLATVALGLGSMLAGTAAAASASVSIASFTFSPSSVTIDVGDTVTWTDNDPFAHTVTADDGSFDSGALASSGTFGHTFASAGTFSYHCQIHSFMTGIVTVVDVARPSASPKSSVAASTAPSVRPSSASPSAGPGSLPPASNGWSPLATAPDTAVASSDEPPGGSGLGGLAVGLGAGLLVLAARLVLAREPRTGGR